MGELGLDRIIFIFWLLIFLDIGFFNLLEFFKFFCVEGLFDNGDDGMLLKLNMSWFLRVVFVGELFVLYLLLCFLEDGFLIFLFLEYIEKVEGFLFGLFILKFFLGFFLEDCCMLNYIRIL